MHAASSKRDGVALHTKMQPPFKRHRHADDNDDDANPSWFKSWNFLAGLSPSKAGKAREMDADGSAMDGGDDVQDAKGAAALMASSNSSGARKTPMFRSDKGLSKRQRQMAALKNMPVHGQRGGGSAQSSSYTPTSSSATNGGTSSLSTVTSPKSHYSDPPVEELDIIYEPRVSAADQQSFVNYQNMLARLMPTSYPSNQDILRARVTLTRSHFNEDRLSQALSNAKISTESPVQPRLGLVTFKKLELGEKLKSERVEDLVRRRRKWPAKLPPEIQEIVTETLKLRGVIAKLPTAEVTATDLLKLLPGTWLNDEVINFYGVMVMRRSAAAMDRKNKGLPREGDDNLLDIWVYSSFFYEKLCNAGYQGVKKWSKKFDTFKKDIIIMPVNMGNTHWVCAAINLRLKRFEFYDSMGAANIQVLDTLRDYLEAEHLEKRKKPLDTEAEGWTYYTDNRIPVQANGYDCGVFTSQFIECLSRKDGYFDFSQKNMPYLRQKMVHEIKTMEFLPEEWA